MIFHAHEHTFLNYKNQHLHLEPLNSKLRWFWKRGVVWEDADLWFHELVFQFGYPDVLILHCGGNSIYAMPLRRLQKFVKLTAFNILAVKLNCKIIWSQILPRTYYRQMFSHLAAENAEVRINSSMPNFIIAENGDYFNSPDLQRCSLTFYRDGNHLTDQTVAKQYF